MDIQDIERLQNFSINERDIFGRNIFDCSESIVPELMWMVDDMVTFAKQQYPHTYCRVHDINLGDHSQGSYHYDGKAIDIDMVGLTVGQQARIAMRYFFGGVGLYPEWKAVGLHLDIRNMPCTWVQRDGKYIYTWPDFEEIARTA